MFVRRDSGGIRPAPIAQIREIRLETADDEEVVGQLRAWVDGVYEIQTDEGLVRVRDREILEAEVADTPQEDQPSTAMALPSSKRES